MEFPNSTFGLALIYDAPAADRSIVGIELPPSTSSGLPPNQTGMVEPDGGTTIPAWIIVVFLSVLPLATIVGSVATCVGVAWDRRLHHTLFYFSSSLSVQQVLAAVVVMPPALFVTWQGGHRCSDRLCRLWISADLFLCNSSGLHLSFIAMDAFLRLKDPLRRLSGHGHCPAATPVWSLVVWLGAPWSVSIVQSLAEFALSDSGADSVIRSPDAGCFVADRNFVTLGCIFAYVIPGLVAVGFLHLSRIEVCRFRGRVLCDTVQRPYPTTQDQEEGKAIRSGGQTEDDDGGDEEEEDGEDGARERGMGGENGLVGWDPQSESTSCESVETEVAPSGVIVSGLPVHQTGTRFHRSGGRGADEPEPGVERPAWKSNDSERTSLRVKRVREGEREATTAPDDLQLIPDQGLRRELSMYQLIWVLVAIHVALWLPYSVGNAVYSLCRNCRPGMTFVHLMTFKWLAYSSSAVSAVTSCCFLSPIRRACWSLIKTLVGMEKRRRRNKKKACNTRDPVTLITLQ